MMKKKFYFHHEPSITAFEKGLNERYDRMAARVRDIANPGCIEKETKFYFLKEELLRIYCNAVIEKCYFYLAEEDKAEKILENQKVIKTPIVRNGKQATVGYQPDIWKNWK